MELHLCLPDGQRAYEGCLERDDSDVATSRVVMFRCVVVASNEEVAKQLVRDAFIVEHPSLAKEQIGDVCISVAPIPVYY